MATAHILGFPRIGADRELKKALEAYWQGKLGPADLEGVGRDLRRRHWELQRAAGLDLVAAGDFSFYDHVLDTSFMLGAIPQRFGRADGRPDLATYFAMARGSSESPALEMTKWFDTNYHYIVPELEPGMRFALSSMRLLDETCEALAAGYAPKPVLVGPLTFLALSKERQTDGQPGSRLAYLERILPVYVEVLERLRDMGVRWVQCDEPVLATDLAPEWLTAYRTCYEALAAPGMSLLVATYFGSVADRAELLASLPVAGVHLDLVRAPEQLPAFLDVWPRERVLSLGVVDGRNVWRTDLGRRLDVLETAARRHPQLWVAPSCSLLHCPVDLARETNLDPEIRTWLAFSVQKLDEVVSLARGVVHGRAAVAASLAASDAACDTRRRSQRVHTPRVAQRLADVREADVRRSSPFAQRRPRQRERVPLPLFPTTTIGSFPQTPAIREARAAFRRGKIDAAAYERAMRAEIEHAVREQERLELDVLVHGEAERNDMVEYFGEQLSGFALTNHGWVQSYGSRCVKPPIIYGDVERPHPMTVGWITYAQSLTDRPLKGMLTGPVTILQWSFVRDDQPRAETAMQIALAIRDEVADLERAGIRIIQIDEPAFREGLPLRRSAWPAYIDWATRAFRLASSVVQDATQIHTHMCYAEFNDIFDVLALLDADVMTIESSRSGMELLQAFARHGYPNDIGPGVYDIHSPRIPTSDEMYELLRKAASFLRPDQLWVNPDCGLKTRRWEEVIPALRNMVDAARRMRDAVAAAAPR